MSFRFCFLPQAIRFFFLYRAELLRPTNMADAVDLSKLPPEALAQIPAGYPPDGVVSNLVNPPTVGYHILVANSLLMAIMFTFAGLRFYTAIKIKRKFSPDDWATVAALIGSIYYFTIVCMGMTRILTPPACITNAFAAIVVTKFGTHMWDLSVAHMKTRNMALVSRVQATSAKLD